MATSSPRDMQRGGSRLDEARSRLRLLSPSDAAASTQLEDDGTAAQLQRWEHERAMTATEMRCVLGIVAAQLADRATAPAAESTHAASSSGCHSMPSLARPFPFLLPELQGMVADYAAPAERQFVGVRVSERGEQQTAVAGWKIERVHEDQLRRMLLQRRADTLQIADRSDAAGQGDIDMTDQAVGTHEQMEPSVDELLAEGAQPQPQPQVLQLAMPPQPIQPHPPQLHQPQQHLPQAWMAVAHPPHPMALMQLLPGQAPHLLAGPHVQPAQAGAAQPAAAQVPAAPAAAAIQWPAVAAAAAANPPPPPPHAAAAGAAAPPVAQLTPIYPHLPFEYLIEVAGADRVYCRHADPQVDQHTRRRADELAEEQQQRLEWIRQLSNLQQDQAPAPPPPLSSRPVRHCHLLPYLRLLFLDAPQQARLPQLPASALSLVADYASEPADYSFPYVFSFVPAGTGPSLLRVERGDDFRARLWPHISKYQREHAAQMAERRFGRAADTLSQCDEHEWMEAVGASAVEETKQHASGSGDVSDSPHPVREREARRQLCLQSLWAEQCAHDRRSSDFVHFLRSAASPAAPAHFAWLLRGGAFDHVVTWQQVIEPPPPSPTQTS